MSDHDKWRDKLDSKSYEICRLKATEPAFSGEYNDFYQLGSYVCKMCDSELFSSVSKFQSDCGWPSFDDAIQGSIRKKRDESLGRIRTEITCVNCDGHLGHVFEGEEYTKKNIRYCVNSLSLKFIPKKK